MRGATERERRRIYSYVAQASDRATKQTRLWQVELGLPLIDIVFNRAWDMFRRRFELLHTIQDFHVLTAGRLSFLFGFVILLIPFSKCRPNIRRRRLLPDVILARPPHFDVPFFPFLENLWSPGLTGAGVGRLLRLRRAKKSS